MEGFLWWTLESVSRGVGASWIARRSGRVIGALLGRRYRSLRDDFRAIEANPGHGDAVARLIVRAPERVDLRRIDLLYHSFMAHPHRYMEERVFAAYWVKRCEMENVETIPGLYRRLAEEATKHGEKTDDPLFWERCLRENHIPEIITALGARDG